MALRVPLLGRRFGLLVCLRSYTDTNGIQRVDVVCDCGVRKTLRTNNIHKTRTCNSNVHKRNRKKRDPEIRKHKNVWAGMHRRCIDPLNPDYGGRGIKVCDRWQKFENFLDDMGLRPSDKHSIGRIDNNGNYEPKNCRWEVLLQQAANTRKCHYITFNGETRTITDWAIRLGITRQAMQQRLKIMPVDVALTRSRPTGAWVEAISPQVICHACRRPLFDQEQTLTANGRIHSVCAKIDFILA